MLKISTRYKTVFYFDLSSGWGCLVLPGVLYKLLIFNESSMFASSMDFMRGQEHRRCHAIYPYSGGFIIKMVGDRPRSLEWLCILWGWIECQLQFPGYFYDIIHDNRGHNHSP